MRRVAIAVAMGLLTTCSAIAGDDRAERSVSQLDMIATPSRWDDVRLSFAEPFQVYIVDNETRFASNVAGLVVVVDTDDIEGLQAFKRCDSIARMASGACRVRLSVVKRRCEPDNPTPETMRLACVGVNARIAKAH